MSRIPGDVFKYEGCWARERSTEPSGRFAKLHTSRCHRPRPQFLIQGLWCGRRACISLRCKAMSLVPDPALRPTAIQLYGGRQGSERPRKALILKKQGGRPSGSVG